MCFSWQLLCWELSSVLEPAQTFFLLCREERGFWYLPNPVCFCWSRAPCVVWVWRKVWYCLWSKVNAEKQETASYSEICGIESGQCSVFLHFYSCFVPAASGVKPIMMPLTDLFFLILKFDEVDLFGFFSLNHISFITF